MFNVLFFFGCQVLTIVYVHLEEQLFEIRVIMFRVDNATDKGTETVTMGFQCKILLLRFF